MNVNFRTKCSIRRIIFLAVILVNCACNKVPIVGILQSEDFVETDGLISAIGDVAKAKYVGIGDVNGCDIVWIHNIDTTISDQLKLAWKQGLLEYVSSGGHLVLSMDAVCLLNEWGIEPNKIARWSYECVDEGFGRKLGFHSRLYHPLFEGLNGGAYPWHGAKDNICRINGFEGSQFPEAKGSRVLACQWEYVFLRPDKKIIWETSVGEGNILAIGGCLYFGRENYDRAILDAFTKNCINYLCGKIPSSDTAKFWDGGDVRVRPLHKAHGSDCRICAAEYEPVHPCEPQKFTLPSMTNAISKSAENVYTDVLSPHSMAIMSERGGIEEIWSQPIMSLRDYRVWVDVSTSERPICLNSLTPTIDILPYGIVRTYTTSDWCIKEIISSSPNCAVTVAHYEWSGKGPRRIWTDFKSNLRMMWPYDERVLGSLCYGWSVELNAMIVRDEDGQYISLVGSNVSGSPVMSGQYADFTYDGGQIKGIPTDLLQVGAVVSYDLVGLDAIDVVFAAGSQGQSDVVEQYSKTIEKPTSVIEDSHEYYNTWYENVLHVKTPDENFNEAFYWAQMSTAQFVAETPGLGRALFAGYASSRRGWGGGHQVSGRPGYSWYFGRDSEWSAFAFADMGDFETVKDCIELMIKYQSPDGKIYHELTTSGVVHYDSADATPLLVVLMAEYLRRSGDVGFVEDNYESMAKAMSYCFSTDRDGDGLIENSNVGHGWLEGGGNLWGFRTEFYLAGIWKRALLDASYISSVTGHLKNKKKYDKAVCKVGDAVEDFWDEEKGYYNYSKNADGSYNDEFLILTAVPIFLDVVDASRASLSTQKFLDPRISTDWGARTIYEDSDATGGGAYHPRNVWPLFTGWKSLAEYSQGLYNQGFSTLYGSMMTYKSFSSGHIAEVINADTYRNNGITQHQCWSEAMVLIPFIEGTLGFKADAVKKRFSLAPCLPWDWTTFDVENLRVGSQVVSMEMSRELDKTRYRISGAVDLKCDFAPYFPCGTQVSSVLVNGKAVHANIVESQDRIQVSVALSLSGETDVEIEHVMGSGVLPIYVPARKNNVSSGFRILDEKKCLVSGRPGESHTLRFYAPNGFSKVTIDTGESVVDLESADAIYDGTILNIPLVFPPDSTRTYSVLSVNVSH